MRKLFTILALMLAIACQAQTFTDRSHMTVGHIKSDGTITDRSNMTIGHIKSDGTVTDRSYMTIGHIKDDGTVTDRSYMTIGYAKGVSKRYAAVFFFFNYFK